MEQVVQAEHEREAMVDSLPELVCLINDTGRLIRTNRTLEAWQLGKVRSIRGLTVHDLLHPGCVDAACKLKTGCQRAWPGISDEQAMVWELYDCVLGRDLRFCLRRSAERTYKRSPAEGGYAVLVVEDISDQKHAQRALEHYNRKLQAQVRERTRQLTIANLQLQREIEAHVRNKEALIESERKYSCLVENTLTGIYMTQGARFTFCNRRFAELFGYSREELYSLEIHQLFDPDDYPLMQDGSPVMTENEVMPSERIVSGITKSGDTLWIKNSVVQIGCEDKQVILGNVIDITEQKNVEKTLRQSEHELRMLSSQLLSAQEKERKRIASELHDGIGQSMSAIKFSVENTLRELGEHSPNGLRERLKEVVDKIRATIEEVRRISMDLRPSTLDDLGILVTIGWFFTEYQAVFPHLELIKRIEIEEREIHDTLKVVIFRILQEALNNIAKHANANNVSVSLTKTASQIKFCITDDGQGFSLKERMGSGNGFGLNSMKERAELSGGVFSIRSRCGEGTTIEAVWPSEQQDPIG